MSGKKRTFVTVEEQELRRLREQESRLRMVSRDLPEQLERVRRDAQREMQSRITPLEERQRQYEGMVQGLQSELGSLERETKRRLAQQHKAFVDKLGQQRGEYLHLLKEQDQKFTTLVAEERQQRQRDVANLQERINRIVKDANRKQQLAQSFVIDLDKILDEVDGLPHQRFAPDQLDAIRRHAQDARSSANSGMPEAALSTAQNAYWQLVDLRVLVLQKEREFLLIHQAAMQEVRFLLEEVKANRKYELELGSGADRETIDLEVDFWTRGELSMLETEVKALEGLLESGKDTLSIEEARDILARIEAMKPRVQEIVEHARQEVIASQIRMNIGELAAEAMKAQGYVVDDEVYVGDDWRNAYLVKVKNIAGSEVVTIVSPVEGEYGKNEVAIHSYEPTIVDEATLLQRSTDIVNIIKGEGLDANAPQCAGDAKPEYRDVSAIRQKKSDDARTMDKNQ